MIKAQKFRRWYREQVLELFDEVDAILAPATPCTAPQVGQQTFVLDGVEMPLRPNIGIYTQPISFIGLPVVAVPVPLTPLPIGVQIIAAPWREDIALRIAHALEQARRRAAPQAANRRRISMEIDLPEVVAEVTQAFDRYETALVAQRRRDARRDCSATIRAPSATASTENLYGYDEITVVPRRALAGRPRPHASRGT